MALAETVQVASGHGCYNTHQVWSQYTKPLWRYVYPHIHFSVLFVKFVHALFKNGLTNQLEFHIFLPALSEDDLSQIWYKSDKLIKNSEKLDLMIFKSFD